MLRRGGCLVVVVSGLACSLSFCLAGSAFGSDGRLFEMVSPAYKGGYGAGSVEAVAQDGESVAFYSPGAFAGAPAGLAVGFNGVAYLARRGATSWSTVPVMPPDTLVPQVVGGFSDTSLTLDSVLVVGKPGPNAELAFTEGNQEEFLLHRSDAQDVDENWEVIGMPLENLAKNQILVEYAGASTDFCHLFVKAASSGQQLLAVAAGAVEQLYELTRGCNDEQIELRLVSANNSGSVISKLCPAVSGISLYPGSSSAFNAIASDGSESFFTTCIGNNPAHFQLFVRLGATRTVEISKPLSEACGETIPCVEADKRASSEFVGASEDGSRVFFTTTASLTGEPGDSSNSMYLAVLGCRENEPECPEAEKGVTRLVRISRNLNAGGKSGVQGVVRVAPDGSRVYFVATGDLLGQANRAALEGEGKPTPHLGADNLYMYDEATEQMAFIGDLCSGLELSGTINSGPELAGGIEDSSCPGSGIDTSLWSGGDARTAGVDGRFLVFPSYAQLTGDDTDAAKDIYRYDAVNGVLQRVSVGEAGYDANGNDSAFDATLRQNSLLPALLRRQHEMQSRAVSEDGSRIVFMTAGPLSPGAINGLANAYEWHDGEVSLVSSGSAESPITQAEISASGNDVFFVSTQGLVPQDTDGASDVYDAHMCTEGSPCFEPAAAERKPCEGDACQGPLSNPTPVLVPGSVSQEPGGNFTPAAKAVKAKHNKAKLKKAKSRKTKAKKVRSKRARAERKHGGNRRTGR